MKPGSQGSDPDSTGANRAGYWRTLLDDLSGDPRHPAPGLWTFRLLPLILGIFATIIIMAGNYDLRLQQAIYRAGGDSWALGEHPFWRGFYHVGVFPGVALGVAALLGLSLSWARRRFGKWRRVYIYAALLLFLGPGVIVNFSLKDHWGRPRPRQVDSMGGKQAFENVFVFNESREGKSFPCGHASVGFVLMGGFFVFCRHRRRLAYGWLICGLGYGALIGLARMFQGAHFLSDVIWAALICYYLALLLYFVLGLKDSVSREATRRHRIPFKVKIALALVAVASIIGILLATPYRDEQTLKLHEKWADSAAISFKATLASGQASIIPSEAFHVWKKSSGHGVPTSRVAPSLWESGSSEVLSVYYLESPSGWFHELETETKIGLPWDRIQSLEIESQSAEVVMRPGELRKTIPVGIGQGAGVIKIQLNGNKMIWGGGDRQKLKGGELLEASSEIDKGLILNVSDEFTGVIEVTD